jgi:hypothetical protein
MAKAVRERFVRAALTLIAASLTFAGPTYLLYVLQRFALPSPLLLLLGLAFFTVGIILFVYLQEGEDKLGASS